MELFDEEHRRAFVADGLVDRPDLVGPARAAAGPRPPTGGPRRPAQPAVTSPGDARRSPGPQVERRGRPARHASARPRRPPRRRGRRAAAQRGRAAADPPRAHPPRGDRRAPSRSSTAATSWCGMGEVAGLDVFVTITSRARARPRRRGRRAAGRASPRCVTVVRVRRSDVRRHGPPGRPALPIEEALRRAPRRAGPRTRTTASRSCGPPAPRASPRASPARTATGRCSARACRPVAAADRRRRPAQPVPDGQRRRHLPGCSSRGCCTGTGSCCTTPSTSSCSCEQIEQQRVTYTCAPPPVLNAVVSDDSAPTHDLSSLRAVSSGSAPLSGWMIDALGERTTASRCSTSSARTRAACCSPTPTRCPTRSRAAGCFPRYGRPGLAYRTGLAAAMSARLVDLADGTEIDEPGRPGELRLKGPSDLRRLPGPWPRDGFDEDGWFCTGDVFEIATRTSRTCYVHVDRAKDLIIRGGYKISAVEIEALVTADPRVAEVAAVALPDDRTSASGSACSSSRATRRARRTSTTCCRSCARRTWPSFKWPERLEIVAEPAPQPDRQGPQARAARPARRTTTGVN